MCQRFFSERRVWRRENEGCNEKHVEDGVGPSDRISKKKKEKDYLQIQNTMHLITELKKNRYLKGSEQESGEKKEKNPKPPSLRQPKPQGDSNGLKERKEEKPPGCKKGDKPSG